MNHSCLMCGAEMVESREARRYGKSIDVVLENVRVLRCPSCGEEEIELPNIEDLHALIAKTLARKPERLTPGEIRWLRTHLGYSSVDFAKVMGVQPETVSRWERTDTPKRMQLPAEKLLRVMALHVEPVSDYGLLEMGSKEPTSSQPLRVRSDDGHWGAAAV